MDFLLPQGIGDSVWALHKIKDIAAKEGDGVVNVHLACQNLEDIQTRALEFCKRFSFVNSAKMAFADIMAKGNHSTPEGYYCYIPDGFIPGTNLYALMPNAPLERGIRLENWLPQFDIDWRTMEDWAFTDEERNHGTSLAEDLGPYAVFYFGPLHGNTVAGHNREMMWTPVEWAELGRRLQGRGLKIVCVGAHYDRPYWERALHWKVVGWNWHDFIGRWEIGQTLAVLKRAQLVVSYQSGIGIVSSYLGVPTAMWWRPKGNSITPGAYVSFEESMATAWVRPDMLEQNKYLPLIYGRESVDQIEAALVENKWI